MTTKTLTVQLPAEDVEFVEAYAKQQGKSVSEVLDQYIHWLQSRETDALHPEVRKMTGILPAEIEAEAEYHQHILEKHR